MSRAIGWCVLPLLAACSSGGETGASSNTIEPPSVAASAATAIPTDAKAVPSSGGLAATVSGLSADESDLNVRITDLGTVIDLPADALFDYDEATLTPAAETELRKAAALIGRSPAGPVQVIGHTDSKGDDAYNQKLSEARARTVAGWFGQQVGIRQRTFQVSGKGETAPIAPNETPSGADDPQGRSKNRRVEVVIPTA
jgi:outer membrane protein OmpA-like peptidoglycan-associated protein